MITRGGKTLSQQRKGEIWPDNFGGEPQPSGFPTPGTRTGSLGRAPRPSGFLTPGRRMGRFGRERRPLGSPTPGTRVGRFGGEPRLSDSPTPATRTGKFGWEPPPLGSPTPATTATMTAPQRARFCCCCKTLADLHFRQLKPFALISGEERRGLIVPDDLALSVVPLDGAV